MQCCLKTPCNTCSWSYIGETGRSFNTRKKEHSRNVKMHTKGSNVANHAWSKNHQIDFGNALLIDKADYRHLKTLESWHTAKTVDADNNSCPLPNQYRISFHTFSILTLHSFTFIISPHFEYSFYTVAFSIR